MRMHRVNIKTTLIAAIAALGLSGCVMNDPPSRGGLGAQSLNPEMSAGLNVAQIRVIVPRSLVVSEDNGYKPVADIVWHGEAVGNRYAQVERIASAAMAQGAAGYRSGRAVVADVQIMRFHALTPKTRASIGGKHELVYLLTLRERASGAVLLDAKKINATVRGAGGAQAQAEEAAGRSQAVVIREALAQSLQKELARIAGGGRGSAGALVSRSAQNPANP
ncbi:MAG: DUF6778 family protein [Cypionkella sp.]|nr:DUF6778 family protein [Cypionkella sp.]